MVEVGHSAPVNVDSLPPTQYLILEVLAARCRLGESYWTFPNRCSRAARVLEEAGLVWVDFSPAAGCFEARFTDAGRAAMLSGSYSPPCVRQARNEVVDEIASGLEEEIGWQRQHYGDGSDRVAMGRLIGMEDALVTVRRHGQQPRQTSAEEASEHG